MTLYINTASYDQIIIALREGNKELVKKIIKVQNNQAEKLMPAIESLLKARKIKLSALKKIVVANRGGSFTSLRIGVISANALAYALNIPVEGEEKPLKKNKKFGRYSLVEPIYDREPNIGQPKKSLLA